VARQDFRLESSHGRLDGHRPGDPVYRKKRLLQQAVGMGKRGRRRKRKRVIISHASEIKKGSLRVSPTVRGMLPHINEEKEGKKRARYGTSGEPPLQCGSCSALMVSVNELIADKQKANGSQELGGGGVFSISPEAHT